MRRMPSSAGGGEVEPRVTNSDSVGEKGQRKAKENANEETHVLRRLSEAAEALSASPDARPSPSRIEPNSWAASPLHPAAYLAWQSPLGQP